MVSYRLLNCFIQIIIEISFNLFKMRWLISNINRWVILIAIGVFLFSFSVWVFLLFLYKPSYPDNENHPYKITVISAPIMTPQLEYLILSSPTQVIITSATDNNGIKVESVVQIYNTDGEGLRLRDGPGTTLGVKFIALDSELYNVSAGPEEADGYVWWYLVSPYDENRSGWAASKYLMLIDTYQ